MGEMKQRLIEDMDIHEVKELLNNFNSDRDNGYVKFLEQQLEIAEDNRSPEEIISALFYVVKELRFMYKQLFWEK